MPGRTAPHTDHSPTVPALHRRPLRRPRPTTHPDTRHPTPVTRHVHRMYSLHLPHQSNQPRSPHQSTSHSPISPRQPKLVPARPPAPPHHPSRLPILRSHLPIRDGGSMAESVSARRRRPTHASRLSRRPPSPGGSIKTRRDATRDPSPPPTPPSRSQPLRSASPLHYTTALYSTLLHVDAGTAHFILLSTHQRPLPSASARANPTRRAPRHAMR